MWFADRGCYRWINERVVMALVIGYLVLALLGRILEAAGVRICECDPDCWCKKPCLSLYRWVFPRYHHNQRLAEWKRNAVRRPRGDTALAAVHAAYYDLVRDPFALTNLFADGIRGNGPDAKTLHARPSALRHRIGVGCR